MLHKYGELGEHIENLDFFFKQHFCVWKFAKMKKIKTKGNMLLQNSFFLKNIEKNIPHFDYDFKLAKKFN